MQALFLHSPTHGSVQQHHHHQCHSLSIVIHPYHPFAPFSKAPSTTNTPCSLLSVSCFPSTPHTALPCHHPQHGCLSTQTNTTYHQSNHIITTNAVVKCQHTTQVKCCEPCVAFNKVCDGLDTFPSNLIACGKSNIVSFMPSDTHDVRFCCGVLRPLR